MRKEITRLKKIIKNSNKIVVFSGAGLSTESGIPTYRGAGGLWTKYDPSIYANINYFQQDPSYYWRFFQEIRYPMIKKAKPNNAHLALVQLEKQGKIYRVITQNIDGLHQLAGQSHVIELHGNTRRFFCMNCSKNYSMDDAYSLLKKLFPPRCVCGGILRPDTVFFGEPLKSSELERAVHSAKKCDLFLVVGSSLVVTPAAELPIVAKRYNAKLAIVNIDPTPLDEIADILINEKASKVLSEIIEKTNS